MQPFKKKVLTSAILAIGFAAHGVQAGETIHLSDNVTLDWKATANYSLASRTEDQDPNLNSAGNRNFDKDDLIANGPSLLLEGHLSNGNSGLVFSGSTFYDDVYQDDKFSDTTQKYHGGYSRLLDLYGYTSFAFGESGFADVRVGKHVVAWGEALFFPSISLAQGPSDAIKATVPGAEVKEILLPEDQISFQAEITPNWSVMGHYQYNWHPTTVSEPGSFWSTSETTGKGAYCVVPLPNGGCAYGPRTADSEPDESGQWGIGTRYRISEDTELGFYYLNYNDRIPLPDINGLASTYLIRYAKDVELYGATFTTTTGMNSIAGEISYKKGAPVLLDTAVVTPSTSDVLQVNLNAITNFGRTPIADVVTLTTELAYVSILDVDGRAISGLEGFPAPFNGYSDDVYWTKHGLAFASSLTLSYPGITENWDMSIPLSYQQQISGRTLTGGVGAEGDKRIGVGATFTHPRTGIQVGLKYAAYMGDTDASLDPTKKSNNSDRDNISLNLKYAF
jgi:hypothetical protein